MKTFDSGLRCPNCASEHFILTESDTFQCQACDKIFDLDLEGVEIDIGSQTIREELKAVFYEKKRQVEYKRAENKKLLDQYTIKETQRKLEILSYCSLFLAIAFILNVFLMPYMAILAAMFAGFFVWARIYRKKTYEKYHPMVLYYAHIVVECDNKIANYTRLLSRLTR